MIVSRRYYSSSNFFEWLRGKVLKIEKPTALPMGDWSIWHKKLATERPIANFLTETLPDWLEKPAEILIDPIHNFRHYVVNWVGGTHRLNSKLSRGKWHEMSERMLHSNFDSFVDFIEIEEASHHIAWRNKDELAKYNVPWHQRTRWFSWAPWRCPQAGIDHLKWEMTLDVPDPNDPNWQCSPHQAKSAREKMELYVWWTQVRPLRGTDTWEASGLNKFWEEMDKKYPREEDDTFSGWLGLSGKSKLTPAEKREYDRLSAERDALEVKWEQEDTDMLVRLMKMRGSLWT